MSKFCSNTGIPSLKIVFPIILRILTLDPAYRMEFEYRNTASKKSFSQNLVEYRNTVTPYAPLLY